MKINSSFLKKSLSLNSSYLPRIYESVSSSSSSQLRLFSSLSSAKRPNSFEFKALLLNRQEFDSAILKLMKQ